jgi:hypothetical protein
MAEQAHEQIRIEASPDACLAVVLDLANYPTWAKDVKSVEVRATDAEGRPSEVEFRAAAMGRSMRYVLQYDYGSLPTALSWKFLEGDMVNQLDGTYSFAADGEATVVTYDLIADIAAPLPGIVKRRAASMITGTALKELKKAVESGA